MSTSIQDRKIQPDEMNVKMQLITYFDAFNRTFAKYVGFWTRSKTNNPIINEELHVYINCFYDLISIFGRVKKLKEYEEIKNIINKSRTEREFISYPDVLKIKNYFVRAVEASGLWDITNSVRDPSAL